MNAQVIYMFEQKTTEEITKFVDSKQHLVNVNVNITNIKCDVSRLWAINIKGIFWSLNLSKKLSKSSQKNNKNIQIF